MRESCKVSAAPFKLPSSWTLRLNPRRGYPPAHLTVQDGTLAPGRYKVYITTIEVYASGGGFVAPSLVTSGSRTLFLDSSDDEKQDPPTIPLPSDHGLR